MIYVIFGPPVLKYFVGAFENEDEAKAVLAKYSNIPMTIFMYNCEVASHVYVVVNKDGMPLHVTTNQEKASTIKQKYALIDWADEDDINYHKCKMNMIRDVEILESVNVSADDILKDNISEVLANATGDAIEEK